MNRYTTNFNENSLSEKSSKSQDLSDFEEKLIYCLINPNHNPNHNEIS